MPYHRAEGCPCASDHFYTKATFMKKQPPTISFVSFRAFIIKNQSTKIKILAIQIVFVLFETILFSFCFHLSTIEEVLKALKNDIKKFKQQHLPETVYPL